MDIQCSFLEDIFIIILCKNNLGKNLGIINSGILNSFIVLNFEIMSSMAWDSKANSLKKSHASRICKISKIPFANEELCQSNPRPRPLHGYAL